MWFDYFDYFCFLYVSIIKYKCVLKLMTYIKFNIYLVGLGGGYEIPRWLGDNKMLPEWVFPGTSNVLLL